MRCTCALVLPSAAVVIPATLEAAEIVAGHLVFEKSIKMKKAASTLMVPYVAQSRKSVDALAPRRLDCAVSAVGKRGPLSVRGKIEMKLLGEHSGSDALWESTVLSVALNDAGRAVFGSEAIRGLADEAGAAESEIALFRVDFDGGKGKKVTTLTVDCMNEVATP